ncbi:MAG TPA: hypothetical protein VGL94_09390 [Ktedonobacteraceae bacterium]
MGQGGVPGDRYENVVDWPLGMLDPHWGQVVAIAGTSVVHREQIIVTPLNASSILDNSASTKWQSTE